MNHLLGRYELRAAGLGLDAVLLKAGTGLAVSWQSGLALVTLDGRPLVARRPGRGALAGKRLFDLFFTVLALIPLLPLLLVVAALVKMSSRGPVFFTQKREGRDGAAFDILKFRSMRVESADPSGLQQTTRDDPRITPLGRFLRRTSIDELPQLINVLRGDMSLVGPRPHVPGMWAGDVPYRDLVPYYDQRLAVKPGLTGWAQANGLRGPTSDPHAARARVDHDLAYLQNFSLALDIRILVLTTLREFVSGSAD